MQSTLRRAASLSGILGLIIVVTAATQGAKFPGGVFKTNDGTNNIALDFDSTGTLNVYVNNESFSHSTWEARADTLTFGNMEAPEGYACTSGARYLWVLADNRILFTLVGTDDCQTRRDGLVGLVWTKG
jgi:hypothetical protein